MTTDHCRFGAVALFTAICCFFFSDAALGFSLGKIRVTGDFNTVFKAEIPAITDGKEGLLAWVGDGADYKKIGIGRPAFVGGLRVVVREHPALPGQMMIYVTSPDPIFQPSFNLVIKASLGRGVIMKNYFLAVDFQKDLDLDVSSGSDEEREEMKRIARELARKKPTRTLSKREKELATLAKIREEERQAMGEESAFVEPKPKVAPVVTAPKKKSPTLADIIASEEEEVRKGEAHVVQAVPRPKLIKKSAPEPKKKPEPKIKEKIIVAKKEVAPVKKVEPVRAPAPERESKPAIAPKVVAPSVVSGKMSGSFITISSLVAENRYNVVKGESLYKIVKKLGASRKNYDRVVVAIWKANGSKFIKGNIHGLMANAQLDYSRVNEIAGGLTDAEAEKIINEQWASWRNGGVMSGKTVLPPTMAPTTRIVIESSIVAAITRWNRKKEKENLFSRLDFESAKITSKDGVVTAKLMRKEKVGDGVNATPVEVKLKDENGEYKVIDKPDNEGSHKKGNPFVTHVASFKEEEPATHFTEFLVSKGFKAYVTFSFVKNKGSWYRVIIGRYPRVKDGSQTARRVRNARLSRYTRILDLPFAIKVIGPMEAKEAKKMIHALGSKGIHGYALEDKRGGGVNVYVGAYSTEKLASQGLSRLLESQVNGEVVKP